MLRRHTMALRVTLMGADLVVATSLFVALSALRYGPSWVQAWDGLGINAWLAAVAYGFGWVSLLLVNGLYRIRARYSLRSEAVALVRAGAILGIAVVCYLFLVHVSDASRLLLATLLGSSVAAGFVSRLVLRAALAQARRRGRLTSFVLVCGANAGATDFARRLENHGDLGLRVIGHLRAPGESDDEPGSELAHPVIGELEQIEDVLHALVVDEVAICLPVAAWDHVEPITQLCAREGKIVRIPSHGGPALLGGYVEELDGLSVTSLVYGPDRALGLLVKRVLDIFVAGVGLIVCAPVLVMVALLIWSRDGRPLIYRQARVGLHGRTFQLLKFRSMTPDADAQIEQLRLFNEVRGSAFKMTNDPRLTRTGRFLRRTSLDELPQLWNVLAGEMSIVGPRPPLPAEVAGYDVWHRRRLSMKPGITGLWQVSARNHPDFDRWVEHDLQYIDQWSLWLDLKILARTVPTVVSQAGR